MTYFPMRATVANTLKKTWLVRAALLLVLSATTLSVVISQTALPPEVALVSEPLYLSGTKIKGNLTIAVHNEETTVAATYRDTFLPTKRYLGYFEPQACYRGVPGAGSKGSYFDYATKKARLQDGCPSSQFDGNFMNWATSSNVDIFRYGLTGGNRTTDEAGGNGVTIVERAWLPDSFYLNNPLYPEKFISNASIAGRVELSPTSFPDGMWIYNCRNRIYFANKRDTNQNLLGAQSTCDAPFGVPGALSTNLPSTGGKFGNFYEVRSLICDPNTATSRLMLYNANTRRWEGLCFPYGGNYKPVGQIQMNADSLRLSVFSYLQDNSTARYGGVMRSPLQYVGPNRFDQNFNQIAGTNPRTEWDPATGVFIADPQGSDANYPSQGFPYSGAINYINRYGTLNMSPTLTDLLRVEYKSSYKVNDPQSELYYEAMRYLQGKQPTSEATNGLNGSSTATQSLKENYPAYATWQDPFLGFVDSTAPGKGCMRNNILNVADSFPVSDRTVPGNTVASAQDTGRAAETAPTLDAQFWTGVVGAFESGSPTTYTDALNRTQTTSNLASNPSYSWLNNAATRVTSDPPTPPATASIDPESTGIRGGSYLMAGLAYWANTNSFRTDAPRARIKTFAIDVNQSGASEVSTAYRRTRPLYLAAKYGGYDDTAAGDTGNPYAVKTNALWEGSDGDAQNYFLASDAQRFLDALSEIFAKAVEETGSIAGGALSTQRLSVGETGSVYQARFSPIANYWSGRLLKFPVTLDTAGTSVNLSTTPTWEAGQLLTTRTKVDNGAGRNIVIGAPIGKVATVPPTAYTWAALAQDHKDALNIVPYSNPSASDALGSSRLSYLRGDRSNEISEINPTGQFRPRDIVLGDIVNSGLVYQGAPSGSITDSGYSTFFNANKTRRPVIFANANDGMLHAIFDSDGQEAFAYVPGFTSGKMNLLSSQDYAHTTINDSTPGTGEAYIGNEWKSVLVSGTGGGGQGVFALDVTNPATFGASNVLWEFTDRDHPAMGNVIGTPQIVKLRTTAFNAATPAYKWYAVVASGVNNYRNDGFASTTGNPSIFIIDLSRKPSATPTQTAWTEGVDFWRIELPQSSVAIAKGLVGLTTIKNFRTGAVDTVFTGDLQGNVWKLDFTLKGTSSLTNNASTNLTSFNAKVASSTPFFIATDGSGKLQPITGEPVVTNAFFDSRVVSFGTGKFLEKVDSNVPSTVTASFYTVFDNNSPGAYPLGGATSGRSVLQQGTIASTGAVSVPSFVYGATSPQKLGWYVDFDATIGEQQVSDITSAFQQLFFGSIYPTKGACGEGGGRFFTLNPLTGNGVSETSQVGISAAPLVFEIGSSALTISDSTGQRTANRRIAVITPGSKAVALAGSGAGTGLTPPEQVGRLSWRQINNYFENKAK